MKWILLLLLLFSSALMYSQSEMPQWLIGKWQVNGEQSFEQWEMSGDTLFGSAYTIEDGSEKTSEYLKMYIQDGKLVYSAKVLEQNDAKPIAFIQTVPSKTSLRFENMSHDFPNIIEYKKASEEDIQVFVLGKTGKGFSMRLHRSE